MTRYTASYLITADVAPASAKEPSYDSRSRVVTSVRATCARVTCARPSRTRARAGANRARRAARPTRAIGSCQFGALTAFASSRDERSSPGCGATGDLWPGCAIPLNQTGELRS